MISKVQLSETQVQLVKQWLSKDCEPYGYDPEKGRLWFWQTTVFGPAKNAIKLSAEQLTKLNQLR